jgi:small-conductance mechanosensitive channel
VYLVPTDPASSTQGRFWRCRKAMTGREIDAANQRTDAASGEVTKAHARAEAQAEQMRSAQVERDEARQLAAEAREAGAKLAGQLEATQAQNAALLAALKTDDTAGDDKPPRGGKGTRK